MKKAILIVCVVVVGLESVGSADITVSGPRVLPNNPATWTSSTTAYIGFHSDYDDNTLNITDGSDVVNYDAYLGFHNTYGTNAVTVHGAGSTWTNGGNLQIGFHSDYGDNTLNIRDGGLVGVAGNLRISYGPYEDSYITMATGGMLALYGDTDDSLVDFLGLISGDDDIRYWNGSAWTNITGATPGVDYTVNYQTAGDLTGYTVLTVPPAPPPLPGDELLFDDFSYSTTGELESAWSVSQTGDEQMVWSVSGSTLDIRNGDPAGGNDQTIIFGRHVDTTGYDDIHVRVAWRANDEVGFEIADFIRIQGYESAFASSPVHVEATTEGDWSPGINPPTTLTYLEADFGLYSWDNPDFWVAIEVNTSVDQEKIYIDSIWMTGTPEPATLSLLALGGLALVRRRKRRR